MLTPTFNQSYTVRLAVLLPEDVNDQGELVKSLQAFYDGDCAPAGSFELELLGRFLVITLGRTISDDLEATNRFADDGMTEITVQEQLEAEYHEALYQLPAGALGQTRELASLIMLELGKRTAKVEGLPCQMVKVRLVCEWVMPAGVTLEQVRTTLHHNRDTLDLISIRGAERELAEFYVEMPGGPIGTYTALDLANP